MKTETVPSPTGAKQQAATFPAPIYRDTVLAPVFADAQRLFLHSLIQIDYAHLVMLAEQRIVTPAVASTCLRALESLNLTDLATTPFDGSVEDLFFLVERRLIECCGIENAGRLHTARSRNDIDATMYRMVMRDRLLQTLESINALRSRLLVLATEHRAALMPAYTHNQPAQPTTLGHYLMAYEEILGRDGARIQAAFTRVNRNPLGACAITTTGFPIDRHRTAELLGFEGLQLNSYGAIAAVDYVAESCSVLATAMLSLAASPRTSSSGPPPSSATCASLTPTSRSPASCRRSATPSLSSTSASSHHAPSPSRKPSSPRFTTPPSQT